MLNAKRIKIFDGTRRLSSLCILYALLPFAAHFVLLNFFDIRLGGGEQQEQQKQHLQHGVNELKFVCCLLFVVAVVSGRVVV